MHKWKQPNQDVHKQRNLQKRNGERKASHYYFQLNLFADASYSKVADIIPLASWLIFRLSLGPLGLDGPTLREAECK